MGCTGEPEPRPRAGHVAYPQGWATAIQGSPHKWASRLVRGNVKPIAHCLRLDWMHPDVHGALVWFSLLERNLAGAARDLHPYHAAVAATIQSELNRGQSAQYEEIKG